MEGSRFDLVFKGLRVGLYRLAAPKRSNELG
jgi:hypothetical protein